MLLKVQNNINNARQNFHLDNTLANKRAYLSQLKSSNDSVSFGSTNPSQKIKLTFKEVNQLLNTLFLNLEAKGRRIPKIRFQTQKGNRVIIMRAGEADRIRFITKNRRKTFNFRLKQDATSASGYNLAESSITIFNKTKRFGLFGENTFKRTKRSPERAYVLIVKYYANEALEVVEKMEPQ